MCCKRCPQLTLGLECRPFTFPGYTKRGASPTSKWYGVSLAKNIKKSPWHASIARKVNLEFARCDQFYATEREAAIGVNMWQEQRGLPPANIIPGTKWSYQ